MLSNYFTTFYLLFMFLTLVSIWWKWCAMESVFATPHSMVYVRGLISAMVGVFIPWETGKCFLPNQGFLPPLGKPVVKHLFFVLIPLWRKCLFMYKHMVRYSYITVCKFFSVNVTNVITSYIMYVFLILWWGWTSFSNAYCLFVLFL